LTVEATLLFRRAYIDLMEIKGWKLPDMLMEQKTWLIPARSE
jgi:hypothetical protein